MSKKYRNLRFFAIFSVTIMVAVAFHPAINPFWDHLLSDKNEYVFSLVDTVKASDQSTQVYPTANQTRLFELVQDLNVSTPLDNRTDRDNDGLYDSVELVIGTDLNNSDSDFDGLSDYDEVLVYLTDPRQIDSNNDGITDYFEVTTCNLDVDNDGIENAWDNDNDNDSVPDNVDMSPFSCSNVNSTFHFDIETTGNPTYIDFQVTPSNSNYLKLAQQTWDWPYDAEGSMIDLDDSKEDVIISPTLEVTIPTDFIITVKHSQKCLGVKEGGNNVEQISYNESDQQRWKLDFFDEGYYKILSEKTGKCLEVFNESSEDGANVQQADFSIKDSQLWRLEPISDGYYNIINKHSEKCLEVANENMSAGANVQQNDYWGVDNQLWKIDPVGTFIPSLEDMIDYGILVELNTLSIPLSPVYDYGNPVALKGRMFYPATNDTNITFDTELVWKVGGNTDKKVDILQQISTAFNISVQDNNTIILNDAESSDPEKFEIKDLGSDMVALGTYNGLFVTVKDSNKSELVANSTSIDDQEMFSLVDLGNDNIALKAWNGNYVTTDETGMLSATSSSIGSDETFKIIDAGYTSNLITLSRYKENFRFTGFSVQENHGSDVGLFYSKHKSQTLAASFFMAYQFLRNSSNSLKNMNQTILQQTNVTVNSTMVTDINHMDLAILEITSKMTPTVLEDLDNQTDEDESILPVIIAIEDDSSVYSMDEYYCGQFTSNSFSLSLSLVSTATTKFFKVGWYNVSSKEVLGADEFLNNIKTWGLEEGHNESSIDSLMSLALVWNVGESRVVDPSSEMPSSTPNDDLVLEKIQSFGIFPLTSLIDIAELVIRVRAGYQFLRTTLGKTGSALKGVQAYYKIMNTAKATKTFKYIGKVSKVLLVIDVVISFVIALYSWFSFADDHGWSDFGVYVGWLSYMVIMNWAGLYLALAFAGPVGVLLAIILAIFDIIFGIGEKIMGWIIDLFTKVEQRSKIDVDLLGSPLVFIDDIEDNGVDSGDILNYKCKVAGNVTRTSDGSWGDVIQSYIHPDLRFNVPANTNWGSSRDLTKTVSKYPNYRLEEYQLSAWTELRNMVNFPITIKLTYDYKIYYDECFWFFGWHCDRESTTDESVNELTTMHFDVMPETLDDFLLWSELKSNDIDGDRLLNENESSYKSSTWNYDSDGDGLWDGFEVDRETLPNKFDSDNDGLSDKIELQIQTDPLNVDTDNDGLTDYEEWKGWPVKFNYFGESFTMNESSDPLKNDTDSDGLLDIVECLKRLNPRSNDTNGNGISDYHEIVFPSYSLITEVSFNEGGNSIRIAPNETINTTIDYRLLGLINPNTLQPDNCSLMVCLEGSNVTQEIYNGTPTVGLITNHSTSFIINNTLNSSIENDTYLLDNGTYIMHYYINWNYT
ncbi:MAG TPA: RICIN domain-containing protein, partial [Candidatus Thermoplasmatota archaeon]|nr:RICIN domain-containing protein [Candidatus Thermoplasmatota archaeon]